MTNISKRLITFIAVISAGVLSGCNSLNTMVSDETKFGQVYMLESILSDAAADCSNRDHLFDSKEWSRHVSGSLEEYTGFLDKESTAYIESKALLAQLPKISGYYGEPRCTDIAEAAEQTRKVIAALTGKPMMVASL